MGNQKYHFVCLACRRSVKRAPEWHYVLEDGGEFVATVPVACALCSATMFCAGKYFAAPKRRDDAGWKKLAWMIENSWRGNSWRGADWPTSPAMNLSEARESLRALRERQAVEAQRAKESQSFEEARRNVRWGFRRSRVLRRQERTELLRQRRYQKAALARAEESEK